MQSLSAAIMSVFKLSTKVLWIVEMNYHFKQMNRNITDIYQFLFIFTLIPESTVLNVQMVEAKLIPGKLLKDLCCERSVCGLFGHLRGRHQFLYHHAQGHF